MTGILRTLLLLVVVGGAVVLGIQNSEVLSRDFSLHFSVGFASWVSRAFPLWLVLLVVFAAGMLLGGASLLLDYVRVRRRLSRELRAAAEARQRADEAIHRAEAAEERAEAAERRAEEAQRVAERQASIATERELEPFEDEIEIVDDEVPDSTALAPRSGRTTGRLD